MIYTKKRTINEILSSKLYSTMSVYTSKQSKMLPLYLFGNFLTGKALGI